MRWSKVNVEAIAYELPTEIVTSAELEAKLNSKIKKIAEMKIQDM